MIAKVKFDFILYFYILSLMNNNIYPEYCKHGNPIYYSMCPGCRAEKRKKREEYAEKYWEDKRINFMKYFNEQYDFYFTDPSVKSPEVIKIREDDKFFKLKKSNSQEQLKKEYHKLAKKYHPDKPTGNTKLMQKLSQIYELLKSTLPLHH